MSAAARRIEPDRAGRTPIVGLAVDSVFATDLLDHRTRGTAAEFGRAVEEAGVDFLVFGRDRLSASHPDTPTLDPTVAAVVLARHTTDVGIVVAAAVGREHPYNVARRLASVDHGSRGRVGWLVGTVDRTEPHADAVWVDADPLDATADAVTVVRSLWGSWPATSIVRDRSRGVFVDSGRIVHIDHDGVYRVAGPLNVPEPPQVRPPVFWSPRDEGEEQVAGRVADVVVVADAEAAARYRASLGSVVRSQVLLADVTWAEGREPVDASLTDGVLVHGGTSDTWSRVIDAVARPPQPDRRRVTLRERLGLAVPEPETVGVRLAFPVA
ncbi:LLM class flavin-dependent oxidoreductase [Rhodococcus zopfii]|uniref:LLM class flavin-dependent oxidoreductase n=1 Tax=Rhodococcus zopfii TaxID=43772 RepID=UPI0009344F8D|nr:LLM class flavin-dependent oxidoreductase [Rhodococcus zopfii]